MKNLKLTLSGFCLVLIYACNETPKTAFNNNVISITITLRLIVLCNIISAKTTFYFKSYLLETAFISLKTCLVLFFTCLFKMLPLGLFPHA